MLPVLANLVLEPSWAVPVLLLLSLVSGAWQVRSVRLAGDGWKKALQAGALWAVGTAAVVYFFVRKLAEPGNNDLFHLKRPLVIPLHTYGLLVATAFLVAMQLAGRAVPRRCSSTRLQNRPPDRGPSIRPSAAVSSARSRLSSRQASSDPRPARRRDPR